MEIRLSEILAISGSAGLFKYVAQSKGGVIVESLDEQKRRQNVSGSAKVSSLGDIAMFTNSSEVSLGEVFDSIYAKYEGKAVEITNKSTPAELAAFMKNVLEDYDADRVHNSDIKKLAQWYNILVNLGVAKFTESEEETEGEEGAAVKVPSPAKTAAARPKAAPIKSGAASSKSKVTATKSTTARKAQ
ncbi:MAG: DUF5606 domain-containing protein [Rikenellaceae bacterium]